MTQPTGLPRAAWLLPRGIAVLALLAVAVGRSLAPALRGARVGLDATIACVDVAGAFVSYLFAFAAMFTTLYLVRRTRRERKLGAGYRWASVVCAAPVVLVLGPACYRPLPNSAAILIAAASATLALCAAGQTLRIPHSRALGVLLLSAGTAAWLHIVAGVLAWEAGERALYALAVFARILATSSVMFDAITVFTAFAWLMTRPQKEATWLGRGAVFLACVLAWSVARGAKDGDNLWHVVADRFVARQLTFPPPYVWEPLRYVLEAGAPLLAAAVLVVRGQVPALAGAVALLLLARPATDVPLSAVGLTLASLFGALAARDDRSLWAVLLREQPANASAGSTASAS